MSLKQNDITNEARQEAFDEFMLKEFENENLGVDPDDYPDAVSEWIEALTDEQYNAYVDKFSDFINSK